MIPGTFANLKELREKLLGYRFESVVRLTGLTVERLRAIEEGDSPTVHEIERLAGAYGIEDEKLGEVPIRLAPGDGVQVLASLPEFRDIDDVTRAKIVRVANAARDLVRLARADGQEDPRGRLRREIGVVPSRKKGPPFSEGSALAAWIRTKWSVGARPIPSLRDLIERSLPSLAILYADLGPGGPAGLTFVDGMRGPTIVLNLVGKNTNPAVRRFSLAHELCHLLVDWGHEPLAVISGYLTDSGLAREQRANAFAVRLLCPESALKRVRTHSADPVDLASALLRYGLHYSTIRLYLEKQAGVRLDPIPTPALAAIGTEAAWTRAEEPAGIEDFPLRDVPFERRTAVARVAARLYSAGHIPRDAFADALGVTPGHDLERVLDYLGLDIPPGVAYALA